MDALTQALLRSELRFLHANLRHYLKYWPDGQAGYKPHPDSFTLLDLASHLYTLPAYTAAILRGAGDEAVLKLAGGPWSFSGPDDLGRVLDEGMAELGGLLDALPEAEMRSRTLPFPFGDPRTAERHLLDLITHIYHHRGQFHLYLKQLGKPVSTDDVFAE